MQELNLQSLPTAPYDVSNAILPPPSSVENVVAPTQATTLDSFWLPSREVLTPGTLRRCESIARRGPTVVVVVIVIFNARVTWPSASDKLQCGYRAACVCSRRIILIQVC